MSDSPSRLYSHFKQSGSVTIGDTVTFQPSPNTDTSATQVILENEDTAEQIEIISNASQSDIQYYVSGIETAKDWKQNGYSGVNGWTCSEPCTNQFSWNTPKNNSIYLVTRNRYKINISSIEQVLTDDSVSLDSYTEQKITLYLAKLLHQVSAREFDYLCKKYESIYQNLQEISGIGGTVASQLIRNCSQKQQTYANYRSELINTQISKEHYREAKRELQQRANADDSPVDPAVREKYSDIVLVREI